MLLAIDAGNTDIVFGLYDGNDWVRLWRLPSKDRQARKTWGSKLKSELKELHLDPTDLKDVVVSSVVPEINKPLRELLVKLTRRTPQWVGPEIYPTLAVKVHNPQEMGTDLVANAVAAYDRFKQKCLVVDFGTALTFTTIADDGKILGVAIAPGLQTAVKALFLNAAQLPEVPLEVPESALGQNTIQAIQAGVVMGYAGMVNYLIEQIRREVGSDLKVIATGGLSEVLTPIKVQFDAIDRLLTLEGLALIATGSRR
jgi:type III pantothenate kinase